VTARRCTRILALSALVAAAACRSGGTSSSTSASASSHTASALPRASSSSPHGGDVVPADAPPPIDLANAPGPAPSGSTVERNVRETAVLALLGDPKLARRLPVVDLEPGREFDAELRERVARRIVLPELRFGDTKAEGPLPRELVQRVVRQNFGRYRSCVAEGLPATPKASENIRLELEIEPDGRVGRVQSTGSTLKNAGVLRCIVDATKTLEFPERPQSTRSVQILELAAPPPARR
jgi:hypothetical protein